MEVSLAQEREPNGVGVGLGVFVIKTAGTAGETISDYIIGNI